MSLKPELVPQATVVEQVKVLTEQRHKYTVQVEQLEHRLKLIENSQAENGHLEDRVKALLADSLNLFGQEWKHRTEFYPDIYLASLEQSLLVIAPPKK
jgi:NADH:ubiquinone oxidoreductase subunit E